MATKRWHKGAYEYQFKHKLLEGGVRVKRFQSEAEGDRFCADMMKSLERGVVPEALKSPEARQVSKTLELEGLRVVIGDYMTQNAITREDREILNLLSIRLPAGTKAADIDYDWVETFVRSLKVDYALAPSTIRKHAGALARCIDWAINKKRMTDNPFRRLRRGFTTYSEGDIRAGAIPKVDQERSRRLAEDEEKEIRRLLAGERPDGRERPVAQAHNREMRLMFDLAIETSMRMREIYTLSRGQISLDDRTIYLTKTKNGDLRQVPLSTRAVGLIRQYLDEAQVEDLLFPCWWRVEFSEKQLPAVTSKVSRLFQTLFHAAGCKDLHFHDLRHEAISRFFEQTNLSEFEIAKISGHRTPRMLMRYANLRASSLSKKLV